MFLHPRLSEQEQKLYYETIYREEYEVFDVTQRFLSDYFEAVCRIEHLLPHLSSVSSLLEIGSGSAAFLSLTTSYFNRAVGIELDESSQTYMKNKCLEIYSDLKLIEN